MYPGDDIPFPVHPTARCMMACLWITGSKCFESGMLELPGECLGCSERVSRQAGSVCSLGVRNTTLSQALGISLYQLPVMVSVYGESDRHGK